MCYLMGVAELSVVVAVSTQDDNKLLRTTLAEVLILVPWCLRLLCFRPPLGRWQRSGHVPGLGLGCWRWISSPALCL